MDKRKEANLQVKTKITAALMHLMKEKAYEEISISEIVSQAGVSRISYYRNYSSKEDILSENLACLLSRFSEADRDIPPHTPVRRVMTVFFRTARENQELFALLHHAGMDNQLRTGLENFLLSSDHFPTLTPGRIYPASIFSGALFGLLLQWYRHNMKENDTELSNIFCQYMSGLL